MVELIVSGVAAMIAIMFNTAVELLAPLLGFSFEMFNKTFPFAATAYSIFQGIALGIVLLLAAFQILPFFMQGKNSKSTPVRTALFAIFAVFGIYYGNYILSGIIDIAQMPYNALTYADAYAFDGIDFSAVGVVISDAFYQVSILLYIIVLLLIGIAFIKLLLEAIERYVILFVLVYLSPLASSTLASEETSGICKRFFTMFLSQCILMILNIWSLKMVVSVFSGLINNDQKIMALLMCYAFLRIASRLDSYLNQLGLNAAITGAGLGTELMATGMMMMSKFSPLAGGKAFAQSGAGGSSGGVLGMSQKVASGLGKISPISGAADAVKNTVGAVGKTFGEGFGAAKDAAAGTSGSFLDKAAAGMTAAQNTVDSNMNKNLHSGWMNTQDSNLWARAFGQSADPNVAESIQNMANGVPLDSVQRSDIAGNAFTSARAFNAFEGDAATNEASDVAAVLQGTGIEHFDSSAKDAVEAGYGNIDAEDLSYSLGSSGLQAQYSRNGNTETWEVKNAAQYAALTPEQQHGYTAYKDKNGNPYYYRHSSVRSPSEAQKQQQAFNSRVVSYGANPAASPLSGKDLSNMKKNPAAVNQVFSGLGASGHTVGYDAQGKAQIAGITEAMRIPNMPSTAKQQMTTMLNSNSEQVSSSMDGTGVQVSWSDNGGMHSLSVLTPSGVSVAAGDNPAALEQAGYRSFDMDGEIYYAQYQAPPTKAEQHEAAIQQFTADPVSHPLSSEAYYAMRRNPEYSRQVFTGFKASGQSLEYDGQNGKDFAGLAESMNFDGMRIADKQRMVMHMRSNEIARAKVNQNGLQSEWESSGSFNRLTVLTQEGMDYNHVDESYLTSKGYVHTNNNGQDFWTLHESMPTEKAKDPIERDLGKDII